MTTSEDQLAPGPSETSPRGAFPETQGLGRVPTAGPELSRAPKVLGVLSHLFARLTILTGGLSCGTGAAFSSTARLSTLMNQGINRGRFSESYLNAIAGLYKMVAVHGAFMFLMSIMLLVIGIGQLRYKRWARRWTLGWSWAGLVLLVGYTVYATFFTGTSMTTLTDEVYGKNMSQAMYAPLGGMAGKMMGGSLGFSSLIFYAPYPIALLIFFSGKKLKAAMNR